MVTALAVILATNFALLLRLRQLKRQGALSFRAAAYFAPVTDGPLVLVTFAGLPVALQQAQRMRQGRLLKLFLGREHIEVADRWVSYLVFFERAIALAAFVLWAFVIGRIAATH